MSASTDRLAASTSNVDDVLREVSAIRAEMVSTAAQAQPLLELVHARHRESARNLLHYLSLRRRDLRPLQVRLAALGLSSLGRAEPNVLATIDAVLRVLRHLAESSPTPHPSEAAPVAFGEGQRLLAAHTDALLGPPPPGRGVRIMVAMPSEAARDPALVRGLLQQGMDCMRINCAHDDAAAWLRMIEHLRQAQTAVGRSCRVVMDLAGPKLRTGPLEPAAPVLRVRPQRDAYGCVTAPARVWLTADGSEPPSPADACLPVPAAWLAALRVGGRVQFTDARGARRALAIVDVTDRGCWSEAHQTAYIVPGTVLQRDSTSERDECRGLVGDLPARENALLLQGGDRLIVTRNLQPGRPAVLDSQGRVLTPARIGCTIPEVFDNVRPGDSIWFDDGKIGAVVENVDSGEALLRITQTRLGGAKLRGDKGINLPDSKLPPGALTSKDLEDLAFVARHADVVELSFANTVQDVEQLQEHLRRLGSRPLGIVLKIETRRGFESLPEMLLTAMRWPCCGVMIARGDLAVECGFERLAGVQEEILWICEAAHVPVIWATQVLETLAREGMPSRAEITDAATGDRAECVMLNKSPHVLSAVRVLDDILRRMQAHQTKKRSMLRELRLAHALATKPRV